MNTTYIRDSALKVIGFIQTDGQGKQFAYAGWNGWNLQSST